MQLVPYNNYNYNNNYNNNNYFKYGRGGLNLWFVTGFTDGKGYAFTYQFLKIININKVEEFNYPLK